MFVTHDTADTRAPMASAPLRYADDGTVDWGTMWDSFCVLAREGGPPHRALVLLPQEDADTSSAGYRFAVAEIARGIAAVSGLAAEPAATGWLAVQCYSAGHARWLAESIEQENVRARADGTRLLVPVGEHFALQGEIKNVITAVAKTTHYWHEHLPAEVKQTMEAQAQLERLKARVRGWFGRRP